MRRHAAVFLLALFVVGCSDDQSAGTTTPRATATTSTIAPTSTATVDSTEPTPSLVPMQSPAFPDRPYDVFVPSSYDDTTPTPLVISLHGFTSSGELQDNYVKLQPEAEAHGFLYIHPDGETSPQGHEFWNATEACSAGGQAVDDSGYLTSIIDEVSAAFNIDPMRVYLVGYSNGGFMSYRMACEHADRIAAIVSLGGATFLDPAECSPSEPVSILEIHGTKDETIEYDGGSTLFGTYPSASTTFETWSAYNGCSNQSHALAEIDVDTSITGMETSEFEFEGCPVDGAVEEWVIVGGSHHPLLAPTFATNIIDWLYAHPKAK